MRYMACCSECKNFEYHPELRETGRGKCKKYCPDKWNWHSTMSATNCPYRKPREEENEGGKENGGNDGQ